MGTDDDGLDLIWGVKAIASFINRTPQQTYHMLSKFPCATYVTPTQFRTLQVVEFVCLTFAQLGTWFDVGRPRIASKLLICKW